MSSSEMSGEEAFWITIWVVLFVFILAFTIIISIGYYENNELDHKCPKSAATAEKVQ